MSRPRGERDLCKNKNPWQSPFKLIKKNKYANEKKKANLKKKRIKNKNKKKAVPAEVRTRGKWYRRQSPYTIRHANIAYLVLKFTIYKVLP